MRRPTRPYPRQTNGARRGPVRSFAVRTAVLLLLATALRAGPPFRTDDPEPVADGHFEVYLFATGTRTAGQTQGSAPALEVNYGILPDTQFHLVLPRAYDGSRGGLGDTEVGIKYRLLEETPTRPQVGIFPLVELPSSCARN